MAKLASRSCGSGESTVCLIVIKYALENFAPVIVSDRINRMVQPVKSFTGIV